MILDFSIVLPYLSTFLKGTKVTIEASVLAILIGLVIGTIVGIGRVIPSKPINLIAWLYVYVIRGTPLLVQLFVIYFGLPSIGIELEAFTAGVIGLGINSGGYVAEIVRGGIEAVPKGQIEAAKVLGLNYLQTMWHIILPQAIRNMLPALGNEFVTLVKESSLLSTLAIIELTMVGQQVRSVTFASFEVFIVVALIYLIITTVVSMLVRYIERKWQVR
ncbi:MAG: amino acid ABC transporter permease [Synergistetes bacterium]|nr:amino acid ABC transporter permease [Synergistota bacterium]MCX8127812.1 amino acid ABC transporter permease [Synergistota bacterium]MDW8192074.1 amino acid ABC transporter permease [Synergistota bacterium]